MSEKFTTKITNDGVNLINQALTAQKQVKFSKAVASQTAFSTDQLTTISDSQYANASKNQDGAITNIEIKPDNTVVFEILFDGQKINYDYTLNTIFVLNDEDKVFAVIKANQPQYMNAYTSGSSTDLQINAGVKVANTSVVDLTVDQAALATQKDISDLKTSTDNALKAEKQERSLNESTLTKKLDDATTDAQKAHDKLSSANDSLSQKIFAINTTITDLNSSLADLKKMTDQLHATTNDNDQSILTLVNRADSLSSQISKISSNQSTDELVLNNHTSKIFDLYSKQLTTVYQCKINIYSMHWDTANHSLFYGIYKIGGLYFMFVSGQLYALHDMGPSWDMDIGNLPANTEHLIEWTHTPAINFDQHWIGAFSFHDGKPRLNTFNNSIKQGDTIQINQWTMANN